MSSPAPPPDLEQALRSAQLKFAAVPGGDAGDDAGGHARRRIGIIAAMYLAGLLLTFGQVTARIENSMPIADATISGALAGIIWPIYWPLRMSYLAFAEETPR
jgi:hypothetical protein